MTEKQFSALRVLILEDEPLIAMALKETLEELGCVVIGPAYDAPQAMSLLTDVVDLAVLDVNLGGGKTSAPVADALDKAGKPFFFATGHGSLGLREADLRRPRIDKPYDHKSLSHAISNLIESGQLSDAPRS